jgi:hypothetical protein
LGGDTERIAILDDVAAELHGLLKSLLLLPEVGVLPELVEKLEAAAQYEDGFAPGEDDLLRLLRALEIEIRRIDKSSPDGWMRIAQMINGRDSSSTIRDMNPVNKTPI